MLKRTFNQKLTMIAIAIFVIFSLIWAYLKFVLEPTQTQLDIIGGTYGLLALYGGIVGLLVARKWGGLKSLIGRAITFLSLGLLAQEFGQLVYTYLGTTLDEIPYPSVGDIGYMGSVFLYIAAAIMLAKATGFRFGVRALRGKLVAVIVPLIILAISYAAFLRDYEFDWSNPLVIFLDFGYPLGQSIYIAIALLVFLLSRKLLGGVMRPVILFLLGALCIQYISDYTFLYKNANETWEVAGINDYMYLVSYLVMTIAILRFGALAKKLKLDATNLATPEQSTIQPVVASVPDDQDTTTPQNPEAQS